MRRRPRQFAFGVALAWAVFAAGAGGCGVYVRAPHLPADEPAVTIYIADYGRHSSLLLPRPDGGWSEYAFGQWDWYALGKREWWRAPGILLLPSRSTLGTRTVAPAESAESLARRLGMASAHPVRLSSAAADALRDRLDRRLAANWDDAVASESFGLEFVPTADWYWLPYNCNTAVASWLRELDCRVSGMAILAEFEVRTPTGELVRPLGPPAPQDARPEEGIPFPPLPR